MAVQGTRSAGEDPALDRERAFDFDYFAMIPAISDESKASIDEAVGVDAAGWTDVPAWDSCMFPCVGIILPEEHLCICHGRNNGCCTPALIGARKPSNVL